LILKEKKKISSKETDEGASWIGFN